jgi:hypothetical protein
MRWAEDYHLFLLGAASFGAASLGRAARHGKWRGWVRVHVSSMGLSYVVLLTAFYVDNGKNLPVWRDLPHLTYWLVPSVVGIRRIMRAVARYGHASLP